MSKETRPEFRPQIEKVDEVKYTIHFETIRSRPDQFHDWHYSTDVKIYENDKEIAKTHFSCHYPGDFSELMRKLRRLYDMYYDMEYDETKERIKKEMLATIAKILYKILKI